MPPIKQKPLSCMPLGSGDQVLHSELIDVVVSAAGELGSGGCIALTTSA